LEEIYQSLKKRPRGDKVVQPPSQVDGDDESGDEMDEEENEIQDGQAMAVDASPREDANLPIVDEDGFQLVQGKGRRRR
jgi:pre-rRNA-processing protein TSR2